MKLIINNITKEFENIESAISDVLTTIHRVLEQNGTKLTHLVIDGIPIYKDYEIYLNEQIETIQEIVVETQKRNPLIEETLEAAFDYIGNAILLLKPLAEGFYQSPGQETWNQLADLFEGIEWLLDAMSRIDKIDQLNLKLSNYVFWNEYVQIMKEVKVQLPDLEQAMVNRDHVLIGDIILYEILPILEIAKEKLRFLVPSGGEHVS